MVRNIRNQYVSTKKKQPNWLSQSNKDKGSSLPSCMVHCARFIFIDVNSLFAQKTFSLCLFLSSLSCFQCTQLAKIVDEKVVHDCRHCISEGFRNGYLSINLERLNKTCFHYADRLL